MAVFRIQWLLSTQLVLDLPAMTRGIIASVEATFLVDLVRSILLPFLVDFLVSHGRRRVGADMMDEVQQRRLRD